MQLLGQTKITIQQLAEFVGMLVAAEPGVDLRQFTIEGRTYTKQGCLKHMEEISKLVSRYQQA